MASVLLFALSMMLTMKNLASAMLIWSADVDAVQSFWSAMANTVDRQNGAADSRGRAVTKDQSRSRKALKENWRR